MDLVKNIIDEMDGRMENIKIFYPFLHIKKSLEKDEEYPKYDMSAVCMAVLSFLIYEGRLKYKGVSLDEITIFLDEFITKVYADCLEREDLTKLSSFVLDKIQNNGSNFLYKYYSYKFSDYRQKIIKIIEMKLSDENDNLLYYYITKDGLDFFLKTKEFPEETQVTINLLLFRKQIEKGSFEFAYDTVKRLNIEVQRKIEKKNYVLDMMMYARSEGAICYREYHESASNQFEEENQLFSEVSVLLRNVHNDYIDKLNKNIITKNETKAFMVLKKIESEMNEAIRKHTRLLEEATNLTKQYDDILKLRAKSAFSERFNFEGELEKMVKDRVCPSGLKHMIQPFIQTNKRKIFNPLKVFEAQKFTISKGEKSHEETDDSKKVDRKLLDDLVNERVSSNFSIYTKHLLDKLEEVHICTLEDWSEDLKNDFGDDALLNADFLSFIIALNHGKSLGQKKNRFFVKMREDEDLEKLSDIELILKKVCDDNEEDKKINVLEVEPIRDEEVCLGWGIKSTNITFRGGA